MSLRQEALIIDTTATQWVVAQPSSHRVYIIGENMLFIILVKLILGYSLMLSFISSCVCNISLSIFFSGHEFFQGMFIIEGFFVSPSSLKYTCTRC